MAEQPDKPTPTQIREDLRTVQNDWREIGEKLGLNKDQLTQIELKEIEQNRLERVLTLAQDGTWADIAVALHNIGQRPLAQTIATTYGTLL